MLENKSTHRVEVVPVVLENHPNADSLSIVKVWGYQVCVRTSDWEGVSKAAYIPPDSTVLVNRPEFLFLANDSKADGRARIRAKKLRGIVSYGMLVPVPSNMNVGDDVTAFLGVEHYEPPLEHEKRGGFFMGGEVASSPKLKSVKYDLEAFRRYHEVFIPGEPVVVTEKVDGASARYVFCDGEMHCGSRTEWKRMYPKLFTVEELIAKGCDEIKAKSIVDRQDSKTKRKNLWWDILEKTPLIELFCRGHEGIVVHGEIFGNVNCIKYGLPEGNRFACFDIMSNGRWLNVNEARSLGANLPWVPALTPFIYDWERIESTGIPYDFETICSLAEGPSLVFGSKEGTIREGIVVSPLKERNDPYLGRVKLKLVSGTFLEKYR